MLQSYSEPARRVVSLAGAPFAFATSERNHKDDFEATASRRKRRAQLASTRAANCCFGWFLGVEKLFCLKKFHAALNEPRDPTARDGVEAGGACVAAQCVSRRDKAAVGRCLSAAHEPTRQAMCAPFPAVTMATVADKGHPQHQGAVWAAWRQRCP